MRYQFKALQFSLAFHTLIILIIIGLSSSSVVPTNRVIVIDFSIEDSMNGENSVAGTLDIAKTKPANNLKIVERKTKFMNRETETKEQQMEVRESKEVIEPTPTPDTQVQISEVPVLAYPETKDFQYKPVQSIQTNFLTSTGDSMKGKLGGSGLAGKGTKLTSSGGYGNPDSDMLRKSRYLKESFSYIRDMIQQKVNYPGLARQKGWEGKVTVSFIISIIGYAKDIKVMRSSGIDVLDKSAIEAVENASPFPEPPVEAQIIIPITYQLN